jgi:hypothetical protein
LQFAVAGVFFQKVVQEFAGFWREKFEEGNVLLL